MQTPDAVHRLPDDPPAEVNSEVDEVKYEAAIFDAAVERQRERELGAAFAHRCLTVAMWLGVGLALCIGVNGYLVWKVANPDVKYFTTENGRIVKAHPTNEPVYSQSDVGAFGADSIRHSFTLDFTKHREQMTMVGERFSEQGYQDYYQAMVRANLLKAVQDQRMNLTGEVGPGVIVSRGAPAGIYTWEFQYPVTLKLQGQTTSSPAQRFIIQLRIQRVDERKKNAGLEVTQVIMSNAS